MARNNLGLHKSFEWLRRRYVEEGRTLAEMAKEAKVSIPTIDNSLRSHKLK